jgi:3-isopropylmalate dehydrogenase
MLLRHSLGLKREAQAIENAVDEALTSGCRTADLARPGEKSLNTQAMQAEILQRIRAPVTG